MIRRVGGRILFGSMLVLIAIVSVAIVIAVLVRSRPSSIRSRVARAVGSELHLETTIGDLSVHFRPHASLVATDVALRIPGRGDLPPFVAIDRLSVEANPFRLATELLRGHVDGVHVEGLRITIPPQNAGEQSASALMKASATRSRFGFTCSKCATSGSIARSRSGPTCPTPFRRARCTRKDPWDRGSRRLRICRSRASTASGTPISTRSPALAGC
jgi:uncharacterized protein involved in outer membrane biogenesis